MKTSARNCFEGTVVAYQTGAVNDVVELEVSGGARIVAVVTHESAEHLGLKPGSKAFALVKASSVIVATDLAGVRLSARNQMNGLVSAVRSGAVNAEVVIDVEGGLQIAAIVTQSSVQSMALKEGQQATALFKASSVLVGTKD